MSLRIMSAAVLSLTLASCVAPPPPPPPPRAAAQPARAAAQPAIATARDWRDWPVTPGTWTYRPAEFGRSAAMFGAGPRGTLFTIACDAQARSITLSVAGAPGTQPITVRTSSTVRALPTVAMTHADAWPPITHDARLAANDPLIDAMGFSRGRFVVQQTGGSTLVVPAWAEVLRVAEDCRG